MNAVLLEHFARRLSPRAWAAQSTVAPAHLGRSATGGRWLARALADGCSHLELLDGRPAFERHLRRSTWVSGHLPVEPLASRIAATGRSARWFTVLRDPVAQIASHYQWWIEVHRRGPLRYWRHGDYFRALSRRIRATDGTDPAAVAAVLSDHAPLFLNFQARFVLRPDLPDGAVPGPGEIDTGLDRFEAIGLDDDLGSVCAAMTGGAARPVARVNATRSKMDRGVFATPYLRAFLAERHGADIALHARARARRGN